MNLLLEEKRTPTQVFLDHLRLRQGSHDRLEEDLHRNYADDVILITNFGNFEGKNGVRKCASLLKKQLPCAEYDYKKKIVKENVAFLEWSARCGSKVVNDGVDTFVIENGKIVKQTIHYTVEKAK